MPQTTSETSSRIAIIDILRGFWLLAMTLYHFAWDLEYFGWTTVGTIVQPGWSGFARIIAANFLFLVGISLFLAFSKKFSWSKFWKREIQIIAAALLISVATYVVFPATFIFFGILHAIALFSLLGVIFVRLPWLVSAISALLILLIGLNYSSAIFEHPALWWVGLAPTAPPSNDFVPLFPWFAATLAGIATAKLIASLIGWNKLAKVSMPAWLDRPLSFIGRHSLIFYLIHQPILLAAVWSFTALAGPPDNTEAFIHECTKQCVVERGKTFCEHYCVCVTDELKQADLYTPFNNGEIDASTHEETRSIVRTCTDDAENK